MILSYFSFPEDSFSLYLKVSKWRSDEMVGDSFSSPSSDTWLLWYEILFLKHRDSSSNYSKLFFSSAISSAPSNAKSKPYVSNNADILMSHRTKLFLPVNFSNSKFLEAIATIANRKKYPEQSINNYPGLWFRFVMTNAKT